MSARQSGSAEPRARFPFIGPSERAMFAIAAVVCGFFAIPAFLELLAATSGRGTDGESNVGLLTVGTLFFGIPALVSAIGAIRPPAAEIVVDSEGIRVEKHEAPLRGGMA